VLEERIARTVAKLDFEFNGQKVHVAARLGIALFPDHGESEKELIAHADAAMSLARQAGKDS